MSSNTAARIYIRDEVTDKVKHIISMRMSELNPVYLSSFLEQLSGGLPDGLYVDSEEAEAYSEKHYDMEPENE